MIGQSATHIWHIWCTWRMCLCTCTWSCCFCWSCLSCDVDYMSLNVLTHFWVRPRLLCNIKIYNCSSSFRGLWIAIEWQATDSRKCFLILFSDFYKNKVLLAQRFDVAINCVINLQLKITVNRGDKMLWR